MVYNKTCITNACTFKQNQEPDVQCTISIDFGVQHQFNFFNFFFITSKLQRPYSMLNIQWKIPLPHQRYNGTLIECARPIITMETDFAHHIATLMEFHTISPHHQWMTLVLWLSLGISNLSRKFHVELFFVEMHNNYIWSSKLWHWSIRSNF